MNPYQRLVDWLAPTRVGGWVARRLATIVDRRLLRWTNGRVSSGLGTKYGDRILLLTTTGRKSGKPRTVPLLYTPHGDQIILVGSKAGEPGNPAWYYNLQAHPECEVALGGARVPMLAREVEGDERTELFEAAARNYAGYRTYQARVERQIPVLLLSRRLDRV